MEHLSRDLILGGIYPVYRHDAFQQHLFVAKAVLEAPITPECDINMASDGVEIYSIFDHEF
jgi:hypothetical protein